MAPCLKPGMIAHAWSDVWDGWLKHVLAASGRI
jgi:hypothetical protein